MSTTLIDIAPTIEKDERRTLVELYAQSTPLLGVLPFDTCPSGFKRFQREGDLPGSTFRALNAGFVESDGADEWVTERCAMLGGDLKIDIGLVKRGDDDLRANQEMKQVKSMAHKFDNAFVKGASANDVNSFLGLQKRCEGTDQEIDMGGALSLSKLDELIDLLDRCDGLLMPRAIIRRLTAASRNTSVGGFITFDQDQLGRKVTQYQGIPLLAADPNGHNSASLAFDEDGGANTSIYALDFSEDGVRGIQIEPPDIRDIGETHDLPKLLTRVDWDCGIAVYGKRSVARLKGVTNAAVVA